MSTALVTGLQYSAMAYGAYELAHLRNWNEIKESITRFLARNDWSTSDIICLLSGIAACHWAQLQYDDFPNNLQRTSLTGVCFELSSGYQQYLAQNYISKNADTLVLTEAWWTDHKIVAYSGDIIESVSGVYGDFPQIQTGFKLGRTNIYEPAPILSTLKTRRKDLCRYWPLVSVEKYMPLLPHNINTYASLLTHLLESPSVLSLTADLDVGDAVLDLRYLSKFDREDGLKIGCLIKWPTGMWGRAPPIVVLDEPNVLDPEKRAALATMAIQAHCTWIEHLKNTHFLCSTLALRLREQSVFPAHITDKVKRFIDMHFYETYQTASTNLVSLTDPTYGFIKRTMRTTDQGAAQFIDYVCNGNFNVRQEHQRCKKLSPEYHAILRNYVVSWFAGGAGGDNNYAIKSAPFEESPDLSLADLLVTFVFNATIKHQFFGISYFPFAIYTPSSIRLHDMTDKWDEDNIAFTMIIISGVIGQGLTLFDGLELAKTRFATCETEVVALAEAITALTDLERILIQRNGPPDRFALVPYPSFLDVSIEW